jgi:hypothetical protein
MQIALIFAGDFDHAASFAANPPAARRKQQRSHPGCRSLFEGDRSAEPSRLLRHQRLDPIGLRRGAGTIEHIFPFRARAGSVLRGDGAVIDK